MNRLSRTPREIVVAMFESALNPERALVPDEWSNGSKAWTLGRRQLARLRHNEGEIDSVSSIIGEQSAAERDAEVAAIIASFRCGDISEVQAFAALCERLPKLAEDRPHVIWAVLLAEANRG